MKTNNLILLLFVLVLCSCNNYYSIEDFASVEKIDAHYHIYSPKSISMEQAEKDNFKLLSINTNSGTCERVVIAHNWLNGIHKKYPDGFEYACTFCLDGWDEPGWQENTIAWIDQCVADGANAVKVWKNIGMEFRDKNGKLVMIHDPRFDPVFKHIAELGIPLVGHLGEPKNCWLPLNEMTTKNDVRYFTRNPQYHMYKHPEFPSYEEQMEARDRVLEKNPDLAFIGCHLASIEWSVDELAKFLDRFPNSAVDLAARTGQLFYQTKADHKKVRDFFIKYQDRILYGTDIGENEGAGEDFKKQNHEIWLSHWEYFVSDNTLTSSLIDGDFKGLKLPKEVIDKIYAKNTKKWYKSF
jgi:predicted TIM-barrel fold metal-dependent hydrolase